MASAGRGIDALAPFLTGGATNTDPDQSLGGDPSTRRVRGMGSIVSEFGIPGIRIDDVFPANGLGTGTLSVDSSGQLTWTPPGAGPGSPVLVSAGESKVVAGSAAAKAIRVYREAGLPVVPRTLETLELVPVFNGVLSQKSVRNSQRISGATTYRALSFKALGPYAVYDVRFWLPPISGGQATWSIGVETPVAGSLQVVASESTAPTGISWSTPVDEWSALVVPVVLSNSFIGLWVRRVFPASGNMAIEEAVQLTVKFRSA